jgi:hypothetical protein
MLAYERAAPQAQRLQWRSAADLGRCAAKLRDAAMAWGRQWRVQVSDVRCVNAWEDRGGGSSTAPQWRAVGVDATGAAMLWCATPHAVLVQRIEAAMLGTSAASARHGEAAGPSIAMAVATQATRTFQESLVRGLGLQAVATGTDTLPAAPSPAESRRWSGAVRAALRIGPGDGVDVHLQLSGNCFDMGKALRPTSTEVAPLSRVTDVLSRRPVPLRAMLDDIELDIGDILGLRPGDIVMTQHPLSRPLRIEATTDALAGPDRPLYAAHLGSREGRLAVALRPSADLSRDPGTQKDHHEA